VDVISAAVVLLALGAPLGLATAWFVSHGAGAIAQLFGPQPPMGWPRGVQEDDDFQWHWPGRMAPPPVPHPAAHATGPGAGARRDHPEPSIDVATIEELDAGSGPIARPIRATLR
jgi:hypothetical protein